MVSKLCSAAIAVRTSVVARAAAVARGAIAALLSSFKASSAMTRSSRDWMAVCCYGQVSHLRVGRLPCSDVRAVSYLSVVQVARDRSFKHVFLGVVVTYL